MNLSITNPRENIQHSIVKNIVCGIIYRQHNSPEVFQNYFENTTEKFVLSGKLVCLLENINVDLLKSARCHYAHDFLLSLLNTERAYKRLSHAPNLSYLTETQNGRCTRLFVQSWKQIK